MNYETILIFPEPPIAVVQLNRPKVLNALSPKLITELVGALESLDQDDSVRCIVVTGNERVFAAGADIAEMADQTVSDQILSGWLRTWARIRDVRKPLIAAVSGYALGGGCEVAMTCDMIVASESARFGQPEINLGIIPGAGGTQRLTQAVGKVRAMEMILTGKQITAQEAERIGLVNRVVPVETYLEEAKALAREIATRPPVAIMLAKEAVNKAFELSLSEGLELERRNFYMLFGTEDQKEGMKAFKEKRRPEWKGR
jgi:enoyl-CoA hydratase